MIFGRRKPRYLLVRDVHVMNMLMFTYLLYSYLLFYNRCMFITQTRLNGGRGDGGWMVLAVPVLLL